VIPAIVDGIASIRALGHAVFIAESNVHHVPEFADRLYVLERGEIIFTGLPREAAANPTVARVISGSAEPVSGD
jgi:branched-chain amino acid transport system ATP-binding protein